MKKNVIAFIGISLFLVSCTKANLEVTYTNQEEAIDKWVNNCLAEDSTRVVTVNNGSNRVTLNEKQLKAEGPRLSSSGTVSFHYAGYVFSSGIGDMFDTNDKEVAEAEDWTVTDKTYEILTLTLGKDAMNDGLRNGLEGVRASEECYIIFSGKYGFGKRAVGTIPANSALLYHVWVESISND